MMGHRLRIKGNGTHMKGLRTTFACIALLFGGHASVVKAAGNGGSDATNSDHRAIIEIRVDDGAPRRLVAPGAMVKGALRFVGEHEDPAGDFKIAWNWTADLDPTGDARLDGKASIHNLTADRHVYDLRAAFLLNPVISNASKLGGSVRVTLEMDQAGGVIDVPMGESLWEIGLDEASARRLHTGPFMMGGGGAGTAVADSNFGAPWPGFDAPAIERGFTMRHHGRITSGDKAIFETALVIGGDPEHFVQRRDVESPVRVGGGDTGRRVIELGRTNSNRGIRSNKRNRGRGTAAPGRGISVSKTGRKRSGSTKITPRS